MDLCSGCQEFRRRLFDSRQPLEHGQRFNLDDDIFIHQNCSELSDCADAFCDLCKYFRRELCYRTKENQPYYTLDVEDLRKWNRRVTVVIWLSTSSPPFVGVELKVDGSHAQTIDVRVGDPVVPGLRNRDFDELLVLGREWLKDCIAKHTACDLHIDHTSGFLPTRLLNVGRQGEQSIRLVLSNHLLEKSNTVGYTTLSYCWGNGPHTASTTDENIEQRLKAIPIRLLPKTIQDAVYITRALKIRYLWVDALCIIQDNRRDWEKEIPTMGKIYNHSSLTIAASGARDSSGGCYCKRDAARLPVFDFTLTKTNTSPIKHNPRDTLTLRATLPQWTNAVDRSALAKRGWALQEHSLSRRILFWTEDGLFWACAEQVASEYQPNLVRSPRERGLLDELIKGINSTHHHGKMYHYERLNNDQKFWSDILETYTGLALTVSTDRLPAVVGLGNELARLTEKEFEASAGVWRHNLVQELAWVTSTEKPGLASRSQSIPSWSWASVHQQIRFPAKSTDEEYVELAKVFSLESPKLRVRGRIANFRKTTSATTPLKEPYRNDSIVCSSSAGPSPCVIELSRGTGEHESKGIAVLDVPADVQEHTSELVPCLKWIEWSGATGWLILAPISKKRKLYRRIGWLELNDSDVSDDDEKTITLI